MTPIEQHCQRSNMRQVAHLTRVPARWTWDTPPGGLTYAEWWMCEDARLSASAHAIWPDEGESARAGRESAALHTIKKRWDDGDETEPEMGVAQHMWLMRRLPPEHPQHEEHEEYRMVASTGPQVVWWLREARAAVRGEVTP